MLGVGIIAPFLSLYARSMGASYFMVGVIFSVFSAARIPILPYVGHWSDKRGRKPYIIGGLLGFAFTALLFIVVQSPWQFILVRMAQGISAGMLLPVTLAMLADLTPRGREGSYLGNFNTAFFLGWGVGPLLGGIIYDHLGVAANFLIMAGISLLAVALVTWRVVEVPEELRQVGTGGWWQRMSLLGHRGLLGPFLARAGSASAVGVLVAFMPLLGKDAGLSSLQVGALITADVLVMTFLQRWAGRLADRHSRVALVVGGQVCAALALFCVPWFSHFWLLFGLICVMGAGMGLALPAVTALAVSAGKERAAGMGQTMSLFNLAFSIGLLVGTSLGGLLADYWHPAAPFLLAAALTVAGAGCLLTLHRSRKV